MMMNDTYDVRDVESQTLLTRVRAWHLFINMYQDDQVRRLFPCKEWKSIATDLNNLKEFDLHMNANCLM